jgi:hypothetical protein
MQFYFVTRVEEVLELALETKVDEEFLKSEHLSIFKNERPKL